MKSAKLTTALAVCVGLLATLGTASAVAYFEVSSFNAPFQDVAGEPVSQAGAHADSLNEIKFRLQPGGAPDGELRDVQVDLPAGVYGNPQAVPTCNSEQLTLGDGYCDPAAQVGYLEYEIAPAFFADFPIYNMETPDSQTDVLSAVVLSAPIVFNISVRTDGDYGLTVEVPNINQSLLIARSAVVIWGVPAARSHDPRRYFGFFNGGASAGIPPKPFLSLPARCDKRLTVTLHADSWQNPGSHLPDGSPDFTNPGWDTAIDTQPPLTGCESLEFEPALRARPTTNVADSPTGLEADLSLPQNTDPDGLSAAMLKTAEVSLPEGLVINPSGANGLGACSPAEIGLTTPVGTGDPHFDRASAACPDASKIGSAEVDTPVFADPLKGSVYTMTPHQNPFGSLLGVYVVIEGRGLVIKLAGKVSADPKTGRLTAIFDQNPQLPFEHFRLNFDGGNVGVLRTPAACGSYTTSSTLTPWSAPDTPTVNDTDEYAITKSPSGGSCAHTEAERPNAVSFQAGSTSGIAGTYQPFVLNLRREDGTQQFASLSVAPPPGLLAKLAGTAPCDQASLAAAAKKSGAAELAAPSCPSSSEVGSVYAQAGAGPTPYNAPGKVYLAGPYKGAPLSLAIITPAVAGPFDLGTIVVRAAVQIDRESAQVKALSDPIPTILEGIPLDIRSISVRLDKPEFTLNPTSCDEMHVTGNLATVLGATTPLTDRFQLGECSALGFKPTLKLALKGSVHRRAHPSLHATLTARPGDANIAKAQVKLPPSAFLDNAHIGTICTRVQFNAHACPPESIYGKAEATSPLLGYTVAGPVYLRSSTHQLPDLVADLNGPASQPIEVELAGKTDSVKGALRNTFEAVPDVPVTKFSLTLFGAKKGLIQMSSGFCKNQHASYKLIAQNGAEYATHPKVASTRCGKAKAGKTGAAKRKR